MPTATKHIYKNTTAIRPNAELHEQLIADINDQNDLAEIASAQERFRTNTKPLATTGLSPTGLRNYVTDYAKINLEPERLADDLILDENGDESFLVGKVGKTEVRASIETCGYWVRTTIKHGEEMIFTSRLEQTGTYWRQCKRIVDFEKDGDAYKLSTSSSVYGELESDVYDISNESFATPVKFVERYFEIRFPVKEMA